MAKTSLVDWFPILPTISRNELEGVLNNSEKNKGKVYRYDQIEDLKDILKCKPTLTHYFLCENAEESSKLLNQIKADQSKLNVVGIGYPVFCTDELNNNEKMNSWIQHSKADIDSVVIGLGENAKQKAVI